MARKRTLVVTQNPPIRANSDFEVVATPLDMIRALQESHKEISTVVLIGSFATDELAAFLGESYPKVRVLSGGPGDELDSYLPLYA